MTIFYVKQGRKYVPHSEYSQEFCDSFPKGTHLVMSYPGGSSRRFNIDPAYAPMIAAGRVAEDAISKHIMEVSSLRPSSKNSPLTPAQVSAWKALKKEMGDESYALEWCSYREAAEAGVNAMQAEAEKLLEHPAVRLAYDHFLMVCELTKHETNKDK